MTEWIEKINPGFGHGQFGRSSGVYCHYTSTDYPGIIREELVVSNNDEFDAPHQRFSYIAEGAGEYDYLSDACAALKLPCDPEDEEWDEHLRGEAQEAFNMRMMELEAEAEADAKEVAEANAT